MFLIAAVLGPVVDLVDFLLLLEIILILARVVLSYTTLSRYHPAVQAVHQLTEPVIDLARRVPHVFGNLDFSPFIATIGLYLVRAILENLRYELLTPGAPNSIVR
jgi:YggT family protein